MTASSGFGSAPSGRSWSGVAAGGARFATLSPISGRSKPISLFADILPDEMVAQMHRKLTESDSHKQAEEARKQTEPV